MTKRERRLLYIFLGAIFVLFNFFGVTYLVRKQGGLKTKLVNLGNERPEANSWLAEKDLWQQRKAWMDGKQPKLPTEGRAQSDLLGSIQTSARKQNITIMEQGFGEPDTQPAYQEISMKLKVSGSLESITKWLVELQQPANFQAIPAMSLKSDSDASKVICELTVARWYAAAGK